MTWASSAGWKAELAYARPGGRAGEDRRGDLGRGPDERRGMRRWGGGQRAKGVETGMVAGTRLLGGFKGGDGGGIYPLTHR